MVIHKHRKEFRLNMMCRLLCVSVSGYRRWLDKPNSPRHDQDAKYQSIIKTLFDTYFGTYGSPRIYKDMRLMGHRIGKRRVERLMREMGLDARPHIKRAYVCTTFSEGNTRIAENLLNRDFHANQPNTKWVGDITYIRTQGNKWIYLATVIDLYSRKVIGHATSQAINTQLVLDAIKMAVKNRSPQPGLIFHSDRGVQYSSDEFIKYLKQHGIRPSMSGKGDCYDNAVAESFFQNAQIRSHLATRYFNGSRNQTEYFLLHRIVLQSNPTTFDHRLLSTC